MNFSSPEKAAAIAERAYFIYLKRVEQGLPGDEHNDWLQAVAENEAPPAPPMGARTAGERSSKRGPQAQLEEAAKVNRSMARRKKVSPTKETNPLSAIKGIGPKALEEFQKCGVSDCSGLASWKQAELDKQLPRFAARSRKEKWLDQARKLSSK